MPWGGNRFTNGTTPTSYRYTGQRESEVGLYYYGARFYDPQLGRFVSPDMVIPQGQGSQAWDRYAGMNNNPVRYTDPTGHLVCSDDNVAEGDCSDEGAGAWRFGVTFEGDWTDSRKEAVRRALVAVGSRIAGDSGLSSWDAFDAVYGGIQFTWCEDCVDGFGWAAGDHEIRFDGMYADSTTNERLVVHELGHMFDRAVCSYYSGTGSCNSDSYYHGTTAHSGLTGRMGTGEGGLGRPSYTDPNEDNWGFAGGFGDWQFAVSNIESTVEVWADMMVGYTYDTWRNDPRGNARQNYMDVQMTSYIQLFIP
jgi:RHS repeat-associated protein